MNNLAEPLTLVYGEPALALLNPISLDFPAGADLSYSTLFDEIREARRQDDAGLAQGDWATEIKSADWGRVRALCETAFQLHTKDLQLAAWYAEALVHQEGFSGLNTGLQVIHGLVSNYWSSCYPPLDISDLDERCGKIEWINTQLPIAIRNVPMTNLQNGSYTFLHWQESRWVENLGLKNPKAKTDAIADGKISGEVFDKAARQSGRSFYEPLVQNLRQTLASLEALIAIVDRTFGNEAPSLSDIRQTINDCLTLADRLYMETSGRVLPEADTEFTLLSTSRESIPAENNYAVTSVGALNNRADAIRALRDVAHYFRINEPQSPVILLAERAARWAEMSLDEWLTTVIKDDGTLGQLRELLDIRIES